MKFLVEIEVQGPLAIELRRYGTVEACQTIERMVRDGFLTPWPDKREEMFLTVRAMEHVTAPAVRVL